MICVEAALLQQRPVERLGKGLELFRRDLWLLGIGGGGRGISISISARGGGGVGIA